MSSESPGPAALGVWRCAEVLTGEWVCVRVVDSENPRSGQGSGPAGPYFVLGSSSNPRFIKVQDPCDLKEYALAFDVLRLKRYHMGLYRDE
jgi:hypothetical protein